MASIKLKFRLPSKSGIEGALYFQIIKDCNVYHINTSYRIPATAWNNRAGEIVDNNNCRLSSIKADVEWEMQKLKDRIEKEEDMQLALRKYIEMTVVGKGFFDYIRKLSDRLEKLNRERSSETMMTTLRSFMRFRGNIDLSFERIDKSLMEQYEAWLKSTGVSRNTSSFYMRNLRTAYKMAVEDGITADYQPFRRVYTGVDKTTKRAISKTDMRKIKYLDLMSRPALQYARDIFMFSFYTRGMSFVDMAYLKKKDLHGGVLTYRRKKTGQELTLEWRPEMQEIVDRYSSSTKYLLNIITQEDGTERRQYQNRLTQVNRHLKTIGEMIGLSVPLTTYVSRHAWATIAKSKNIPLSVISEGLGHDNEQTTKIYLESIRSSAVDRANRQILKDL